MKRIKLLSFIFLPLFCTSCNKNIIDMPKSPFNDSYQRIGATSEFPNLEVKGLVDEEFKKLQDTIKNYKNDIYLKQYKTQEETRDLRYAYFGKQDLTMSMCTLNSENGTYSRYNNLVTTKERKTKQLRQVTGGILSNNLTLSEYIVDMGAVDPLKYYETTASKKNDEALIVTSTKENPTEYLDKNLIFGLSPYEKIKNLFTIPQFTLLGNHAVYGKCNINNKENYIVKEGYSIFKPYDTAVGHSYKAVDNYFYELLLENNLSIGLRLNSFRFYTEKLILSESCESSGVPVIYLEKPVLVSYSEIKYSDFNYESIGDYNKDKIPEPTK